MLVDFVVRNSGKREWIGFEGSEMLPVGTSISEPFKNHPGLEVHWFKQPFRTNTKGPLYDRSIGVVVGAVHHIDNDAVRKTPSALLTKTQLSDASTGGTYWDDKGGLVVIGPMDLPARVVDAIRHLEWSASSRLRGHVPPRGGGPLPRDGEYTLAEARAAASDHTGAIARQAHRTILSNTAIKWKSPHPQSQLDPDGFSLATALDLWLTSGSREQISTQNPIDGRLWEALSDEDKRHKGFQLRWMDDWWRSEDWSKALQDILLSEMYALDPGCADTWANEAGAQFWRINNNKDGVVFEWLRWVAAALWRTQVGPRLANLQTRRCAVVPVELAVPLYSHERKVDPDSGEISAYFDGQFYNGRGLTIAASTDSGTLELAIKQALKSAGSAAFIRALAWMLRGAHGAWAQGAGDGESFPFKGSPTDLARALGMWNSDGDLNKRGLEQLWGAIEAGVLFRYKGPSRAFGGLWSYDHKKGSRHSKGMFRFKLGAALSPNQPARYSMGLLTPVADPCRAPSLDNAPRRIRGRFLAADQMLFNMLTRRSSGALVNNGQALFTFRPDADMKLIGDSAGLKGNNAKKWLDRVLEGDGSRDPILIRDGTRAHVGPAWGPENSHWLEQRQIRINGRKRQKSSKNKGRK